MSNSAQPKQLELPKAKPLEERILSRYRLLAPLGVGGMGEVWAAEERGSAGRRIVAIKTAKQMGDEARRVLFDEARIASLIKHPNVCRVREAGREQDTDFLVLDWCDGASLQELIVASPDSRMPISIVLQVAIEVAAGLHAAHELCAEDGSSLGVVHRDVSPQNVLIGLDGRVIVTDFGVAKAHGQSHEATKTGEVKGKISYMSPEQLRTKLVDRRVDIFALGCVVYFAVSGVRPFHGDDAVGTIYQILESNHEPLSSRLPNVPECVESLVSKALAKDPNARFQTMKEFADAADECLHELGLRVRPADVAAYLVGTLGEKIHARNAKIFALGRSGDDGATISDSIARAATDSKTHTVLSLVPAQPSDPAARWKWGMAAVLFASTCVGFGLVYWKSTRSRGAVGPVVSAVPTVSTVSVVVEAKPEDAEILLNGEARGRGSFRGQFPKNSAPMAMLVRREGYLTQEEILKLETSGTWRIELRKVTEVSSVAETPAVDAPRKAGAASSAKGAPSKPKSTPQPATSSGKTPRKLDSSNPFASP